MAYATVADLKLRYDTRLLGDLVSDDGNSVDDASLNSDAVLAALLSDAASNIDSALLAAERYDAADLASLSESSLNLLKRISCDLVVAYLLQRRSFSITEDDQRRVSDAFHMVDRLRRGELVLETADKAEIQAGRMEPVVFTQQDVNNSTLIRHNVKNYYPQRRVPR